MYANITKICKYVERKKRHDLYTFYFYMGDEFI